MKYLKDNYENLFFINHILKIIIFINYNINYNINNKHLLYIKI